MKNDRTYRSERVRLLVAVAVAVAVALGVAACQGGGGSSGGPASNGSGGAPKPAGGISAASIDIKWTGKWQPGDAPKDEFPVYKVTNKASAPLTYLQIWHYFYDKDKKQLGRAFTERYQMSIPPGGTQEIAAGPKKAEVPAGTTFLEAVVIGANFGSEALKFRDKPPAETRRYGGG